MLCYQDHRRFTVITSGDSTVHHVKQKSHLFRHCNLKDFKLSQTKHLLLHLVDNVFAVVSTVEYINIHCLQLTMFGISIPFLVFRPTCSCPDPNAFQPLHIVTPNRLQIRAIRFKLKVLHYCSRL